MDFFILFTAVAILLICIYLAIKNNLDSDTKPVSKDFEFKIKENLGIVQSQIVEKLLEKLNENSLSQSVSNSRLREEINQKLLENLNQSQIAGNSFREYLKLEFENIKSENSAQLLKIQNQIQEKLNISVLTLTEVNNKNFELLSKANHEKLDKINDDVQKRLDENFARNLKSFQEVSQNLGQIQSTAQKMIESTKSIDKLNTIFARTSSKAFGGFAEKYLESMLSENLAADSFKKQVRVPGGNEIIDFVIYIDDQKIGIDCKFPFTVYQDFQEADAEKKAYYHKQFLKKILEMAREISQKYYKNNFLEVLFMYLPSESIYNEVMDFNKNQELLEQLQKLKVSLVSPNTLFPVILLTKAYQFRHKISKEADSIVKSLNVIKKNFDGFKTEYRKLGEKIRQAQQNYDQAERNLVGMEHNISHISVTSAPQLELSQTNPQ